MLRKFVSDTGKDWDKWLPFLLFAYREVPQASTGYSPYELLYGHHVRSPLDVLLESWEGAEGPRRMNVVSYVLRMREQLEQQARQKVWYDPAARSRSFEPGEEVTFADIRE